jgi:hypothetical protein
MKGSGRRVDYGRGIFDPAAEVESLVLTNCWWCWWWRRLVESCMNHSTPMGLLSPHTSFLCFAYKYCVSHQPDLRTVRTLRSIYSRESLADSQPCQNLGILPLLQDASLGLLHVRYLPIVTLHYCTVIHILITNLNVSAFSISQEMYVH